MSAKIRVLEKCREPSKWTELLKASEVTPKRLLEVIRSLEAQSMIKKNADGLYILTNEGKNQIDLNEYLEIAREVKEKDELDKADERVARKLKRVQELQDLTGLMRYLIGAGTYMIIGKSGAVFSSGMVPDISKFPKIMEQISLLKSAISEYIPSFEKDYLDITYALQLISKYRYAEYIEDSDAMYLTRQLDELENLALHPKNTIELCNRILESSFPKELKNVINDSKKMFEEGIFIPKK